jgi:8-oxo-dGTP diphosphatase
MNNDCFYRLSVKALIIDDTGKFLLARESDGTWDLLGGGLNHDEHPVTALQREISEETGLVVTSVSSSPKYFVTAKRPEHGIFIANVLYEATLKDLGFTPSDECEELRYFSVEEARHVKLLPNVTNFLEIYLPAQ